MDHFLPTKSMQSPTFTLDGSDQSAPSLSRNSTSASSNSSWSMDNDTQLYPTDGAFWQDMTTYLCASPTSPYKYPYDETPAPATDDKFFAADQRGPRRVRNKEASPEVILRRRAQNRASQRAYRDRKDRRVKELETELAELTASHEKLESEHSTLCSSHAALVIAEKAWIKEKRELLKEDRDDGGGNAGNEGWSCESELHGTGMTTEVGKDGNFVVKVVICKRCYGEDARVAAMSCSRGGGTQRS